MGFETSFTEFAEDVNGILDRVPMGFETALIVPLDRTYIKF